MTLPTRRIALLTLVAGFALPPAYADEPAVELEGVKFESRAQVDGQSLQLNGTGLRAVAWLKGYAAGLYLNQKASSAEQVMAMPGAKRLSMRILLDVPVVEFVKAFHKGVERNSLPAQIPQLLDRMALFDQLIQPLGKVRKGDTVNLDFMPQRGMVLSHNGRVMGAPIIGDDFYDALLGIFIGDQPVDDKLKRGLLGGGKA